jgi:hypothetical protein
MISRRSLTVLHVLLAGFFFPVGLMFASTGGLYTLAIKGGYVEHKLPVTVESPPVEELSAWVAIAERELLAANIDLPSGGAGLKKAGTSFELEWTGVARDVVLRPTADPTQLELVVKDTDRWRHFVQLHKAKGSDVAKAISVGWAVGLILLLISGLWIALSAPAYRRLAVPAGIAGLSTFAVYFFMG